MGSENRTLNVPPTFFIKDIYIACIMTDPSSFDVACRDTFFICNNDFHFLHYDNMCMKLRSVRRHTFLLKFQRFWTPGPGKR